MIPHSETPAARAADAARSGETSTREAAKVQIADFMQRERDVIRAANIRRGEDMPNRWVGLALSGGGIRSASFALGVLQSLHNWDLFRRIDYLSTVSGGGYIGTALTYFLQAKELGEDGTFPFGNRRQAGARDVEVAPPSDTTVKQARPIRNRLRAMARMDAIQAPPRDFGPRPTPNAIVSYIRLHAHYLTPSPDVGWPAFIGSAIRATFTALSVYFPLLLALLTLLALSEFVLADLKAVRDFLAALSCWANPFLVRETGGTTCGDPQTEISRIAFFNWPLLLLLVVTAISIINAYAFLIATNNVNSHPERRARVYPRVTIDNARRNGALLVLFVVLALLSALPWLVHVYNLGLTSVMTASASTLGGYLGTLWDYRSRLKGATDKDSLLVQSRPLIFAALTVYGLLVLAFAGAETIVAWSGPATPWWVGLGAVLALIAFSFVLNAFSNLNLISQHRLYRDRLMEAFCPSNWALARMKWRPSVFADLLKIKDCGPSFWGSRDALAGPFHLVNTALVVPGAKATLYRSRGSDNFVLSPIACGSDATGWVEAAQFMNGEMTLPTAMAISGAALNAHSGAGQAAPTRNAVLSFLLTLFGAQLGFWAPHPQAIGGQARQPKFLIPGLYSLTGRGLDGDVKRGFVQLADGGHFENLGLYELIRRRTDLIICSDAGQDKDFVFEDLGIATERLRVDFGTDIEFQTNDLGLEFMLPGSKSKDDTWDERYKLAKRGFAVAKLRYPEVQDALTGVQQPAKSGYLLFIKATLIEGLPADLYAYKKLNADFPDQTTVDQDFDEYQFEAYRELGYRLTSHAFIELMKPAHGTEYELDVTAKMLWNALEAIVEPAPAA